MVDQEPIIIIGNKPDLLDKIRAAVGEQQSVVMVADEQEARRQFKGEIQGMDALTGLPGRDQFFSDTTDFLQRGNDKDYILVRSNIENFKVINDLFGRKTGDIVLKDIAQVLKELVGKNGTCGRIEGDHFAFCMSHSQVDLEEMGRQVLKRIKENHPSLRLSLSAGIYPIVDIEVPVYQMCDRAGIAMATINGNFLKHVAIYNETLEKKTRQEQTIREEADHSRRNARGAY